ncbi:TPA: heme lyase CcmF/NrfE family subunit [Escherichia coli]|nr:heme lyase CcmF/NrfE family subunit [Escherichia coli]
MLTPLTAFAGVRLRWPAMMRLTCIGILAQFALLLLAFGVLTYCFLISDFSVIYVAQHSYSLLSWELKLAAVWGGHEGSLLLWVLLLSAWSALFAWHYRQQTDPLFPLTLAVLSLMLATLLLFVVLWSDPFVRIFPPAIEGRDLNPMLQHPGLIFHPPLLYLGYGGLMVAASVALASLLRGEFDGTCARICWRWALLGWSALTAGIILGSWWAYCELGWGGWWFWDPVENASLLPWLSATALLHSLSLTRQRGIFRQWSLLLAIVTLMLSLLGTLIVRSGILVSVHAFALDNVRAVPLFSLFALISLASLALYGWRARDGGPALLAHAGVLLFAAGIVVSSVSRQEISLNLQPGQQVTLAGYTFRFERLDLQAKGNYTSEKAIVALFDHQQRIGELTPERRFYEARRQQMMEPSIRWNGIHDWYAVMGEKTGADRYAFRLYVQSGVRWIWGGGLLMIAGALLSGWRGRKRDE